MVDASPAVLTKMFPQVYHAQQHFFARYMHEPEGAEKLAERLLAVCDGQFGRSIHDSSDGALAHLRTSAQCWYQPRAKCTNPRCRATVHTHETCFSCHGGSLLVRVLPLPPEHSLPDEQLTAVRTIFDAAVSTLSAEDQQLPQLAKMRCKSSL